MRKAHGQKITDRGYRCNSDRLITYEKGRQSERYGVWLPAAKDFTSIRSPICAASSNASARTRTAVWPNCSPIIGTLLASPLPLPKPFPLITHLVRLSMQVGNPLP